MSAAVVRTLVRPYIPIGSVVAFTVTCWSFFKITPGRILTGIATIRPPIVQPAVVVIGPHVWVGWVEEYARGLCVIKTSRGARYFHRRGAVFIPFRL